MLTDIRRTPQGSTFRSRCRDSRPRSCNTPHAIPNLIGTTEPAIPLAPLRLALDGLSSRSLIPRTPFQTQALIQPGPAATYSHARHRARRDGTRQTIRPPVEPHEPSPPRYHAVARATTQPDTASDGELKSAPETETGANSSLSMGAAVSTPALPRRNPSVAPTSRRRVAERHPRARRFFPASHAHSLLAQLQAAAIRKRVTGPSPCQTSALVPARFRPAVHRLTTTLGTMEGLRRPVEASMPSR